MVAWELLVMNNFSKTVEALALLVDAFGYQKPEEVEKQLAVAKNVVGEPGSIKRADLINEARGMEEK